MLQARLSLLLLFITAACTPPSPARTTAPRSAVPTDLREALQLPPQPRAAEALAQLARAPEQDRCAAAWLRANYLLDLFDWVRLAPRAALPPAAGHQLLWRALALPGDPGRGPTATRQVLTRLTQQLEHLSPACPQRVWAQEGLSLLAADQAPRRTHEQALPVAATYKSIARSPSPLAPNARLRLWDWCAGAFRLAAGGDPAQQHVRLLQCLYPLFDANPAPYFSSEPAQRPPDPPWTLLARKLPALLAPLDQSRLVSLAKALATDQRRFLKLAQAQLPLPLDLSRLPSITSQAGSPWDRTPVLLVTGQGYIVGGRALLIDDLEGLGAAIQARLHNDPRGRLSTVAAGDLPAERLLEAGRLARRVGASTLALGVRRQVAARTVAGDVQREVFGRGPVYRLEEIPLSLQLLAPAGGGTLRREQPVGLSYDQRTGENQLAVHIGRSSCRISSAHGELRALPCSGLLEQLSGLRQLYPDDSSLILVPEGSTPLRQLFRIAAKIQAPQSRVRFMGLALGSPGLLTPPDRDLAELVTLSQQAEVRLEQAQASWLPLLQRCYLDVLRESWSGGESLPQGTLRLRASPRAIKVQPGSLRHPALQRCLEQSLPAPATPGTFIANFHLNGVR